MIYKFVPTQAEADLLLAGALDVPWLTIDTETNSKDVRDGRGYAVGVSIAYRRPDGELIAFYLPFWHQYTQKNLRVQDNIVALQKILNNKKVMMHNAKFDLVSMATLGLDVQNVDFYCTMVLAHLIDENQKFRGGFKLDALSKQWLGREGKKLRPGMKEQIEEDASMLPAEAIAEYASVDAYETYLLFEYEYPKLKAEKLLEVWEHKREFMKLLIQMESKGIKIDKQMCDTQIELGGRTMLEIKESLHWRNPLSPKDLAVMLLDELHLPEMINPKTQRRTFDKKALEEYEVILERMTNPMAQKILAYRGWSKTVSSNYEAYLNFISKDGRLRCNYKQHGTLTGRLSCELPNLQQIPREGTKPWNGKLKHAFIPEEGNSLIEADFAQLELRLATAYAGERSLITVFQEGRDVFQEMALAIEQARQDTKTFVYATQYGAGVRRISNVLGITPTAARRLIDDYYEAYPGFRAISNRVQAIVQRHKKVPLWSGRCRHFQFPTEAYKAFNSLIQGGAADIVEHVMLQLNKELPEANMLLTVHDSVVFEIPDNQVEALKPEIHRIMENVNGATGQDFSVPFAVSIKKWGH